MLRRSIALLTMSIALTAASARAQAGGADTSMAGMPMGSADSADPALRTANDQMSGMLMDSPHMRMTRLAAPNAADAARADSIVRVLKASIAKYADYHAALEDGYQIFLPGVKQKVYHFTSRSRALKAAFTFDASKPTSLLYKKTGDGYELVGAMYTAPKRFSESDLNARVPLSVAQWHVHVNLCVPPKGDLQRWKETEGGKPKFGPKGVIASKEACEAEGARWIPQLFGWMVHVDPFETDPKMVWGTHETEDH